MFTSFGDCPCNCSRDTCRSWTRLPQCFASLSYKIYAYNCTHKQLYAYTTLSHAPFHLASDSSFCNFGTEGSQIETAKTEAIIRARVRFIHLFFSFFFCVKSIRSNNNNNNDNSNNSDNKNITIMLVWCRPDNYNSRRAMRLRCVITRGNDNDQYYGDK